ncbi:TIGR03960 family B12-binding radical SAM protein [Desulfobulbus sp.]|uniref:TIGR03960 family B12-binding radical SAM protein n=1 Tax=Desulfobulbus sp. TaxID=895 RepID=UPI0027B9418D|nr:TIGR03960 family B12-binding radical SAM protein [Desulfobulbus sp.]
MVTPTPLDLGPILPLVRKPGQYVGGELHAVSGRMDADSLNFCLVFPDLYEIGMSHQGLQILYHILNGQDHVAAHRAYAPDVDMEQELRAQGLPLFSLEAKVALSAYDVLGITLPYELCYTNILTVLNLGGLPLRAAARSEEHPLVLGGGSCSLNPEPVADFFDAIVLGDGEEIIIEIADLLLQAKVEQWNRNLVLERLAQIAGVYVPAFFRPHYQQGRLTAIEPLRPDYPWVRKRVLPQLSAAPYLHQPLVPVVSPVHDRLGLEIARGCTRGCRFCQAGITYRPVRERTLEEIMELANQGIASSGFEELALLSLSTGDFSCLGELMGALMDRFADNFVSVSMPSMRVGTLTPEIMEQIKRVRKTGFTVAPEAGTDRLREVINKGITEEALLATCRDAFSLGWKLIKLYFMVGLPTETEEDVEGIVHLAKKARYQAGQGRGRPVQVNLGVATFIPKPHTPFQWEPQISLEESKRRINRLKQLLPRQGFKLKWHDPEQSLLEGVFSRGDRRLSRLLETAWKDGARLDSWSEHFSLEQWRRAATACELDLEGYLRRREVGETLPWEHLRSGVERAFLEAEYAKALQREYTPDCRNHGCQGCGLCDFKTVQPVIHARPASSAPPPAVPSPRSDREEQKQPQPGHSYRVSYSRLGDSRFYGHLELLQMVFRVLQRAGLPVLFSSGFNPTPRVSFSQALPVGVESLAESFDMDLAQPLASMEETVALLNSQLPETIRVTGVSFAPRAVARSSVLKYTISSQVYPDDLRQRIKHFLSQETFVIDRFRKNRHKDLDLRPLVSRLEFTDNLLLLDLLGHQGQPATNPREMLEKVLGFSEREALQVRIMKTGVEEMTSLS